MASAPTGTTFAFSMVKSTGMAFSSSVLAQPPAPKLLGPPSITRPHPMSCVLRTSISTWSSLKFVTRPSSPLVRGTFASTIVS